MGCVPYVGFVINRHVIVRFHFACKKKKGSSHLALAIGLTPFNACLYFVNYKVRFPLGIEKMWLCIKNDHASVELLDNHIKFT
jgi:hypothetical protein